MRRLLLAVTLLVTGVPSLARATCVTAGCGAEFTAEVEQLRRRIQRDCECPVRAESPAGYRRCFARILREAAATRALPRPCLAAVRGCERKSVCGTTSHAVVCCVRTRGGIVASSIKGRGSRCKGLACQRPRHAAELCPGTLPPVGPFLAAALTVRDRRTGLEWERKSSAAPPDLHTEDALHVWAGSCRGPAADPSDNALCQPTEAAAAACRAQTPETAWTGGCDTCPAAEGPCVVPASSGAVTTAWDWLAQVNASAFGGYGDWRLPTVERDGMPAELETIVDPMWARCEESETSIDVRGRSPFFGVTAAPPYWSATTDAAAASQAYYATGHATAVSQGKRVAFRVRAVRRP